MAGPEFSGIGTELGHVRTVSRDENYRKYYDGGERFNDRTDLLMGGGYSDSDER
jgi:hypothetical protein